MIRFSFVPINSVTKILLNLKFFCFFLSKFQHLTKRTIYGLANVTKVWVAVGPPANLDLHEGRKNTIFAEILRRNKSTSRSAQICSRSA